MTSSWWQRHVEHEFLVSVRNWEAALALRDRGGGEEYRGVAVGPYGRRSMAGDHGQRRPTAAFVGERHRGKMGEGGEAREQQQLTRSTQGGTARPEVAGR